MALPQITISGPGLNFGGPAAFPSGREVQTTAFGDTATYLRGNHILKFGGEYRHVTQFSSNGDPGNWDFATEQAGGPCGKGSARAIDPATGQPKCCAQYNPESACPLLRTGSKYDRPARRLSHKY